MPFAIEALIEVHDCTVFSAYDGVRLAEFSENLWAESWEEVTIAVALNAYNTQLTGGNILGSIAIGSYDPGVIEAPNYVKIMNCEVTLGWNQPAAIFNEDTIIETRDIQIIGCHVYGYGANATTQPCIKFTDGPIDQVRIIGSVLRDSDPVLELDGIDNLQIVGCEIMNTYLGINAQNLSNALIEGNIFQVDAASDKGAIAIQDNVVNAVIQGNELYGGGASGLGMIWMAPPADTGPVVIADNFIDTPGFVAIGVAAGAFTILGLVIRGNTIRSSAAAFGAAISVGDVADAIVAENSLDAGYIAINACDRIQLLNNILHNVPAADGGAILLSGAADEAWIHGCAVPNSPTLPVAVEIGASQTNVEVRTNSNNWRGPIAPLDDQGTGTIT